MGSRAKNEVLVTQVHRLRMQRGEREQLNQRLQAAVNQLLEAVLLDPAARTYTVQRRRAIEEANDVLNRARE
jgi:hypothetical protein